MSTVLFIVGVFVLFLSFFITPLGTTNALMISAVLFLLAIILSNRKKVMGNTNNGG